VQVSIESEKHNHLLHCAARPIPDAALEAAGIHLHEVYFAPKLTDLYRGPEVSTWE